MSAADQEPAVSLEETPDLKKRPIDFEETSELSTKKVKMSSDDAKDGGAVASSNTETIAHDVENSSLAADTAAPADFTMPTEKDVGITEYVSGETASSPVHGVIKQRFSDFQVFEIDPQGTVCRVKDLGPSVSNPEEENNLLAQLQREKAERDDETGELRRQAQDARRQEQERQRAERQQQQDAARAAASKSVFTWSEEDGDIDLTKEDRLVELLGTRVRDELKALWEQGPNAFEPVIAADDDDKSASASAQPATRGGKGRAGRGRDRSGGGGGGRDGRPRGNGDPRKVLSDALANKEVRSQIHQVIREMFKGRFESETADVKPAAAATVDDDEAANAGSSAAAAPAAAPPSFISIRWNPHPPGKDSRSFGPSHRQRNAEEAAMPPYIHFLLQKTNRDTQDAINIIARALNLGAGSGGGLSSINKSASKELTIAGTKDKRGVTTQRVCLRRGRKTVEDVWKMVNGVSGNASDGGRGGGGRGGRGGGRGGRGGGRGGGGNSFFGFDGKTALDAVSSRGERGIRIAHLEYKDKPLFLGDLKGNRFVIVLRDLQVTNEESVYTALNTLKSQGFINYYGMQRFGTSSMPSHRVGLPLMRNDFATAVELIMSSRGDDAVEMAEAKQLYAKGEIRDAFNLMPRWASAERSILGKMMEEEKRSGKGCKHNDWNGYFSAIPKTLRTMYLHAYQSYIWNKVASERVRRGGVGGPIEGDIVYEVGGSKEDGGDGDGDGEEDDDVDGEAAADATGPSSSGPHFKPLTVIPPVKILTAADVASGQWTIADVLIPSCGQDVAPTPGSWLATYVEELLAEDGLTLQDISRTRSAELTLRGTYRKLIHRPEDVQYGFIAYGHAEGHDMQALCQSDEDAILGIDAVPRDWPTIAEARKAVRASDDDDAAAAAAADASRLALKVSFSLGTSAYATMALREITKVDTSTSVQKSLNAGGGGGGYGGGMRGGRAPGDDGWVGPRAKKGEKVNEVDVEKGKAMRVWGGGAAAASGTGGANGGNNEVVADPPATEQPTAEQPTADSAIVQTE